MKTAERFILIILDGWGLGRKPAADAIAQANTPCFDRLMREYPHATLTTFGEAVGLPEGQMGNSEVGHLNIGAGRIVYQELARINKSIRERELHKNPTLIKALQEAKAQGRKVHFMGLVSDGGVHSHISHLEALCDIAQEQGLERVFIHAFTDGRDCDPKSGLGFIRQLEEHIRGTNARLASVVGRYYAMDRDKRWERVKLAYDLLALGKGEASKDILATIRQRYDAGETDEFLKPIFADNGDGEPAATIQDGDLLICFNFRTDRPREISIVLTQRDMPEHDMRKLDLRYVTMTRYDDTFEGVDILFTKDDLSQTLGEVIAHAGRSQVRIAETEKYPHVTFFFSGGREAPFEGEKRIMIPSPKVATYDLQPEMSAPGVTEAIVEEMRTNRPDFICLNFANTDMVGHTGVFSAAMKAAETVDACLDQILQTAQAQGYEAIIIADHGNSDFMINEDGTPNTAHSMNPVPCIFVGPEAQNTRLDDGKLADLAPTILGRMGIAIPPVMDGRNLIRLLSVLMLLWLTACQSPARNDAAAPFFDLEAFFEEEIGKLGELNRVTKKITLNGETQEQLVNAWDAAKEMESFKKLHINRPAWRDQYAIDTLTGAEGELKGLRYAAQDSSLQIRRVAIDWEGGAVSEVVVEKYIRNWVIFFHQKVAYRPGEGYAIWQTQKAPLMKRNEIAVEVRY
jgi:2,3-bisphosphoglycerate-independent phosphoglycerate mutase